MIQVFFHRNYILYDSFSLLASVSHFLWKWPLDLTVSCDIVDFYLNILQYFAGNKPQNFNRT